jgi:site-specific recombinase XerD
MGVSFYVKPSQKNPTVSVHCSVKFHGVQRLTFRVPDLTVNKKDWGKGKMKTGRGVHNSCSVQRLLDKQRTNIEEFYREFWIQKNRRPDREEIHKYITSNVELKDYFPTKKVSDVLVQIKKIIDDRESGKVLNQGKLFSKTTIRNYRSNLNKLTEYCKHLNQKTISSTDIINKEFILGFENFLTIEQKLKLNTVGEGMKTLKSFLEVLYSQDVIPYNPFRKFKISPAKENTTSIALDEDELEELYHLDLSHNPTLELVRDQFVVLCWTGLRISDFKSFNDIPKDQLIININTKKTHQNSGIPIFPMAQKILDKYNGHFPRMISEQKMNDNLKIIGKMTKGLNRHIQESYTKGGERVTNDKKRYELLSLHVGRRTLITNLSSWGFSDRDLMLVSSHRTQKNLGLYIKNNSKIRLEMMIDKVKELEKNKGNHG